MRSTKFFLLALAVLMLKADLSVAATEAGDDKIFPYRYEMRDLPNGLRVIVIPTDFPNIVSLQIPVQVGSRDEVEPGKTGFAHFFEHMMFRGSENFTAEEYNRIMTNAGADQNAWTSDDLTNYHVTFSREDLEQILEIEADRFIRLQYSEEDFKTEARAILGEYNTHNMNPYRRLFEAQRDAAFGRHTYKHTALGTLEDIMDMPEQYEYSLEFYDRYYRPDNTVIILAGDVDPDEAFALVEAYWGDWEPGAHPTDVPQEPAPQGPAYRHVEWPSPTLPLMFVGFHGPAWSETETDMVAAQLVASLAFGSSSDLHQKLVIDERVVDQFGTSFPERIDPYLLNISARVTEPDRFWYVRDEIQRTLAELRTNLVSEQRLEDIKSNVRYSFASAMDNSETIAAVLVNYVARTRDPESINRTFALMDRVTPEVIRRVANEYFTDDRMVVATLARDEFPAVDTEAGSVDAKLADVEEGVFIGGGEATTTAAEPVPAVSGRPTLEAPAAINSVLLASESPLVDFRILFNVGAAHDPDGREGLANLTAAMVSDAGSETMRYSEIQQALFPLASGFSSQVDKEMTVFAGRTHVDNLERYYDIISGQLFNPGWREEDFERVQRNVINFIRVSLRDTNEEELGKEVLYEEVYRGHPYGHFTAGHIDALERLTLDDVRDFYRMHYTQGNVVLGMGGGYPEAFLNSVKEDMARLPEGEDAGLITLPQPMSPTAMNVTIIEKETRATAISMGFPIEVNRGHPDFAALWLVRSWFGEHRSFLSHLFQRIREVRGMNYGTYAYIEYFPRGMFQFYPDPNLGRQQQIFQIWIRPVEPGNAHFALRAARYELDKLVENGLTQDQFESTRNYLHKFVNVLTKSQGRQLGYALDSEYYDIAEFTEYIRTNLAELTLDDVNRVIGEHLSSDGMHVVMITRDAEGLRNQLVSGATSPIEYDAPKPEDILAEDRIIQDYPLNISAENVRIVPVDEVFE